MATQGVVIADATEATPTIGDLFQGKCFLVQQRVPQRNSFLERIRANGGRIVRLELQADYIIADHLRKDSPPTSLSYTFVEAAIRDGALPDPNDHRAGPAAGAIRAIGSSTVPAKATRTPFTPQDDRDVCNWVHKCQQEGQFIKGYEIYKQLEAINPRHTFQSWRDRFLKKLMNNLPQGVAALQTPTLQPPPIQAPAPRISNVDGAAESRTLADGEDEQDRGNAQEGEEEVAEESEPEGTLKEDIAFLEENIQDILDVPTDDHRVMWESLADMPQCQHLTAVEWQRLYEDTVLPAYEARKKRENASPSKQKARPVTPGPSQSRGPPRTPSQAMPSRGPARLVSPELLQDDDELPDEEEPPTTPELVARKLKAAQQNNATSSRQQARPATPELPQDNEQLSTPELVALKLQAAGASQALPSGTRKRSRETLTPRPNGGRKRAKAGDTELYANEAPANGRVATADMGLSKTAESMAEPNHVIELGEDTEMGNGGHVARRLLLGEDVLPTSELNREAKAQLIAEAAQQDDESAAEANGTEAQVNDSTTPKPKVKAISLIDQTDSQEAGIISPSNIDSPTEIGVLGQVLPAQGLRLTEENLASQQAEHGVKPTRAVDLREDDKDLEGYATYLQKLLVNQESAELANRSNKAKENGQTNARLDPELESDRELSPEDVAAANGDFNFEDSADKNGVEVPANASQDVDMEDNIDLTLAEPEGGFDFSSQEVDGQQKPDQHQWEPRSVPQINQTRADIVISSNSASRDTSDSPEVEQMKNAPARASAQAALDTQDLYAAGAQQQPDFSFPLPPEFDSQLSEAELPPSQPAPKPAPTQQRRQSTRKPASKSATPQKAPTPSTTTRGKLPKRTQPKREPAQQQPPPPDTSQGATEDIPTFIHRLTTVKGCSAASVQNALYRTSAQLQAAELVSMYEKLNLPAPDIPELWTERDDAMLNSGDGRVLKELAGRKGWQEYEVRRMFLKEWNA
ncbi:hypothetical protein Q7P36_001392 [Cladosporium allicinum]